MSTEPAGEHAYQPHILIQTISSGPRCWCRQLPGDGTRTDDIHHRLPCFQKSSLNFHDGVVDGARRTAREPPKSTAVYHVSRAVVVVSSLAVRACRADRCPLRGECLSVGIRHSFRRSLSQYRQGVSNPTVAKHRRPRQHRRIITSRHPTRQSACVIREGGWG